MKAFDFTCLLSATVNPMTAYLVCKIFKTEGINHCRFNFKTVLGRLQSIPKNFYPGLISSFADLTNPVVFFLFAIAYV